MIEITDLSVRFGRTTALDGVSTRFERGECVLLAGANGSGKTTLLRSIAGVYFPRRGGVAIDGIPAGPETQKKTAYIPASLSMYDNLKMGEAIRLHRSFFPHFNYRGIGGLFFDLHKKTGALSRGQKTLFYLSLALSTSPDYLLIDDVIHFLDPHLRDIFLKTLLQLMEERELTVLIAAQSSTDLEGVLERVLLLDNGRIALDDTVENLRRSCVRIYADKHPAGPPVIFEKKWEAVKELYLYPFNPEAHPGVQAEHLTLGEILRAFIGGEYDVH